MTGRWRLRCAVPFLLVPAVCILPARAQAPDPSQVLAARAMSFLHAEEAHKKSALCNSNAAAANTAASTACIGAEFEKTRANYLGFVRALGQLLRLNDDGKRPKGAPQRLPFDDAETAWQTYRDKTCSWEYKNYSTWGPAVVTSCMLTLTENHMAELHDAYGELFQ